jgi:tetratricopeptide (TPR) repeat protein/transcriptional regulator with XRE-family HTH domain
MKRQGPDTYQSVTAGILSTKYLSIQALNCHTNREERMTMHPLKAERELRGWSQAKVAEAVGSTPRNVSRWEKGQTLPHPYYREQLCLLFGKNARELGLLGEAEEEQTEEIFQPGSIQSVDEKPSATPWHVPYQRNRYFTGRTDTLEQLHTTFLLNEQREIFPVQVALCGLGGIGKTQTALEYVYRYADGYTAVLWAQADTREDVLSEYIVLASTLNLPEKDLSNHHQVTVALMDWLRTHEGWLLILDNADDLSMVGEFLPRGGKGHILLTTRAMATGQHIEGIEIEKLGYQDGMSLLLHRAKLIRDDTSLNGIPPPLYEQARMICELVDGLPLALSQIAAYIEENAIDLGDYLALFQAYPSSLLQRRSELSHSDYSHTVATTWALSLEKIERTNAVAADVLRLCAFLQPDGISERLLLQGISNPDAPLYTIAANPLILYEAIGELRKYSFIRRNTETKTLSLHRLVQMYLKETMTREEQCLWVERAVRVVNYVLPDLSDYAVSSWAVYQTHVPHALLAYEFVKEWQLAFPEAARLLDQVGVFLRDHARYSEAEPMLHDALVMREKLLGTSHLLVAKSLNNLAILYWERSEYDEAQALFERALVIRDHDSVAPTERAESLNNLGLVYIFQKRYSEAESLLQRTYELCEEALAGTYAGHAEITNALASSLTNLGYLYYLQGRYQEARSLYQRAYTIWEKLYGPQHPNIAIVLYNLGCNYQCLGDYETSEHYHLRALIMCEQLLGAMHRHTARSLNSLGELYCIEERYTEAEPLLRRALHILEVSLGPTHVEVAASLENLARLLHATAREKEAQELEARANSLRNGKRIQ